jgi:hypothetical protein
VVGRRDQADDQVRQLAAHDVGVVAEAAARGPVALLAHARQEPHHLRLSMARCLGEVDNLDLDDDVRDRYLYQNAQEFFFS